MAERYEAAAIGTSYVDTIIRIKKGNFENHILGSETTFLGKEIQWGGSAPLFSQAFRALNHSVIFIGVVGDDVDGDIVLRKATDSRVALSISRPPGSITNNNVNFVYVEDGGKHYFTDGSANANQQLDAKKVIELLSYKIDGIENCYLAGGLKIPAIMEEFRQYFLGRTSPKIIVDHGRIMDTTKEEDKETIRNLVGSSEFYFPDEAEFLGVWHAKTLDEGFEAVRQVSNALVVVKRGEEGASFMDKGRIITVPSFPVNVINPVGAGDTFNAGLLSALMKEKPLVEAVRFANATAALRISTGKFASQDDVNKLLQSAA